MALVNSKFGTYILYNNDTCELLQTFFSSPAKEKFRKNKIAESDCKLKIQDANVHKLKEGHLILSYFQLNHTTNQSQFIIIPIIEGDQKNEQVQVKRFSLNTDHPAAVAAATIVDTTVNGPSLVTVCKCEIS